MLHREPGSPHRTQTQPYQSFSPVCIHTSSIGITFTTPCAPLYLDMQFHVDIPTYALYTNNVYLLPLHPAEEQPYVPLPSWPVPEGEIRHWGFGWPNHLMKS